MSVSNDWLNLGIIWVNKHLKCLEFNQMWIVLDGSFLTTTIWWLALWKPSFLWFPIYSSAAMKNNFSLKDFCANKKQKTKKPTQTPGTMTLPVVVASLACLLSFNHFWSKPCSCVCFEIKSWLNDCRVRSRSVAKCKILNVVFPLKKKTTQKTYTLYMFECLGWTSYCYT